jgi:hypothetical protein
MKETDFPRLLQGRMFTLEDLETVRKLIAENPQASRRQLAIMLCQLWDWYTQSYFFFLLVLTGTLLIVLTPLDGRKDDLARPAGQVLFFQIMLYVPGNEDRFLQGYLTPGLDLADQVVEESFRLLQRYTILVREWENRGCRR